MREPFVERHRRGQVVLVVVREQQAAALAVVHVLGQDVELDHVDAMRRARRRTTPRCCRARCGRPPCGRRVSVLTARTPERGSVGVALPAAADQGRRSAGMAARRRCRPAASGPGGRRSPTPACAAGSRGRSRAPRRRSPRGPAATGRCRPRSSPRSSTGSRCRRSSAGRAARRRSRASGPRGAAGAGTPASSSSGARMSGPSAASRWSKRVRDSVISSSTGPRSWITSCPPLRITSQAEDGAGPSGRTRQEPVMRRCEWITRSPSKRRKRCLPWTSTERTERPPSRSAQRSRPKRGCGVAISSGTRPSSTGRIRLAA